MTNRFLEIVGIPETMIFDNFDLVMLFDQPKRTISIERPFFSVIDSELLSGMNAWSWESCIDGGNLSLEAGVVVESENEIIINDPTFRPLTGYTIPSQSLSGTFNQAEQRFYVSDGRQYQVVPEPSALSLLVLGGVVVALGLRKK